MCWLSVGQRQPPTHPWRNHRWAETRRENLETDYNIVIYFRCTVYPPSMIKCTVLDETHVWSVFYHISCVRVDC